MQSSYENNWPYARSLLCRKFVKDVSLSNEAKLEDPHLMRFQMFLYQSQKRHSLKFSYLGGKSMSDGRLLAGRGTISPSIQLSAILS